MHRTQQRLVKYPEHLGTLQTQIIMSKTVYHKLFWCYQWSSDDHKNDNKKMMSGDKKMMMMMIEVLDDDWNDDDNTEAHRWRRIHVFPTL
jgi:hypothetical protein